MRLRLVPQGTNWDFFRFDKATFGFSVVAMVASILLFLIVGLNLGIDFRGGTTIRTESPVPVDVSVYRDALQELDLGDISITEVFDPTFDEDQNVAMIRIQAQEGEESVSAATIVLVEHTIAQALGSDTRIALTGANLDLDRAAEILTPLGASAPEDGVFTIPSGLSFEDLQAARSALTAALSLNAVTATYSAISFPSVESVGPKVSGELIQTAVIAVALAIGAVLFYIWLRFEWQFSLGAVAALVHDVVLTIGIFSILQIQFDLAIIAALLTIVGYSLNDTVVVFDRVRENLIKFKTKPLKDVLNISINETLSRTVMTSGTTLLALIALLILGGDVIRGFVFAMTWGVVVGTYSSVFVASNILLWLGTKRDWTKPDANQGNQFANIDT
ncbi:MAG: protein translocase subunit SecF [Pseudomonadota bacterium]